MPLFFGRLELSTRDTYMFMTRGLSGLDLERTITSKIYQGWIKHYFAHSLKEHGKYIKNILSKRMMWNNI